MIICMYDVLLLMVVVVVFVMVVLLLLILIKLILSLSLSYSKYCSTLIKEHCIARVYTVGRVGFMYNVGYKNWVLCIRWSITTGFYA